MRPLKEPHFSPLEIRLFWAHVLQGEQNQCWPWEGRRLNAPYPQNRYGYFTIGRTKYAAHRVALWLATKTWPQSFQACHTCDMPHCCNPSHLFMGTHQDNMRDMIQKGHHRSPLIPSHSYSQGEKNSRAKLTDKMVTTIRISHFENHITINELAKSHSVYRRSMWDTVHGKSWRHLAFSWKLEIDPSDNYGRLTCCALAHQISTSLV